MLCSLIYSALLHKIYSALYQIPVSFPHSQTDIQYTNRMCAAVATYPIRRIQKLIDVRTLKAGLEKGTIVLLHLAKDECHYPDFKK